MSTIQLELSAIKRDWIQSAAPEVLRYAGTVAEFTTDDLRGVVPEPECRNWWGCVLAALKNEGRIVETGRRPSKRPEANGRKISAWRLR
jgi:hypothetical protein